MEWQRLGPASGTAANLSAVWGGSARDVWTAGAGGAVLEWQP